MKFKISVLYSSLLILSSLTSLIKTFESEDYYEILEVSKQANEREIRKAFKRKALQLHPDKNPDDPEAQAKFIKLNRVYEVLKDEELHKKYDLYGEKGLEDAGSHGSKYHSWSYYRDNFGIYDDDTEVITLNNADFEQSVLGSNEIWFINFYHPMCSHCHTLAPVWRSVAQELDGVIRIGAVNCDDSFHLCSSQGIRSYPTLIAYPGREMYFGEKLRNYLLSFILKKLRPNPFLQLGSIGDDVDRWWGSWGPQVVKCDDKPWLIITRAEHDDVDEFSNTKLKLGAIFENMLCLGEADCSKNRKICSHLKIEKSTFFESREKLQSGEGTKLANTNPQEIAREVLLLLPDIPLMSSQEYEEMRRKLEKKEDAPPWLVACTDAADDRNLELKKLSAYLPSFSLGRLSCDEAKWACDELFIAKTPAFILFKMGGGYEMHQGRNLAHDIAVFAREAHLANQFQILTPREFPGVLSGEDPWFVDFYAPWCPPCRKLLPEFRKASRLLDVPVKFGSIDCTTHTSLCQKFNIHQYPTTILYNQTVPHQYFGYHSASHLVDFVRDTLNPIVIELNPQLYEEKVLQKPTSQLWVVDYFANWCGHCLEMAPEFRRFARIVSAIPNVFIAQIDCAVHRQTCQKEGVKGYPTIKLFPFGHLGTSYQVTFNSYSRTGETFRQWLYSYLPSKVQTLDDRTFEEMLRNDHPWAVDFYAPWCGHCHHFAPHFEDIATKLEGKMKFGKIDCEAHRWVCRSSGVRAYPTVKYYPGVQSGRGGQTDRQDIQGVDLNSLDEDEILQRLNKYLTMRQMEHDEL